MFLWRVLATHVSGRPSAVKMWLVYLDPVALIVGGPLTSFIRSRPHLHSRSRIP